VHFKGSNTLLVIGAGASVPYGYPTGTQLLANVARKARDYPKKFQDSQRYHDLAFVLETGQFESIDEALAIRSDLAEEGKLLIALDLLRCERSGTEVDQEKLSPNFKNSDWMLPLFRLLVRNEMPVKIVTFNYDRLLEHVFYRALMSRKTAPDDVAEFFSRISILHAHGRLPKLPYELGNEPRTSFYHGFGEFFKSEDAKRIDYLHIRRKEIISNLRTAQESTTLADEIGNHISWADQFVFLGFGFHHDNMNLLEIVSSNRKPRLLATGFGLSDIRKKEIEILTRGISFPTNDCVTMIHDYLRFGS
jgi:hypothetical protein